MNRPLVALVISLGLAISLPLQAGKPGAYVWKDENGNLQYSDRPPEGQESEFRELQGIGLKGTRSVDKGDGKEGEKVAEEEAEGKDKAAMKEFEVLPEKDPAICKQARDNLKALNAARIRGVDEEGNRRYLSEEEKETQRATARKLIEIHC